MELGLTIVAIIGILLFVIAYLRFVVSGFKHHPVTGIIAMFPVVNLLVVPSLWYKNSRFLVVGFISLLLAAGAWAMGAEKGIHKYVDLLMGKNQQKLVHNSPETAAPTTVSALSIPSQQAGPQLAATTPVTSTIASSKAVIRTEIDESNFESLPTKALYRMGFDIVPVKDIASLKGRVVRVIDKNLTLFEGRVINATSVSVNLQLTGSAADREIPITTIKKLSLMVKKPL